MGADFAQSYPKIAERLRLGPDNCQDPHTERLIEGFAYLTARIRRKLDDDFPEISEAMMQVLYPHYLAPLPSMAIAQIQLDASQAELTSGYAVPKHTMLESEPTPHGTCRYRTCYPLTLWPIEAHWAGLRPLPAGAGGAPKGATAVLRIDLQCFGKEMTFAQMKIPSLRFFLKGQDPHVLALYELIFNQLVDVALAENAKDERPVFLGKQSILPVGFEQDQSVFPPCARSFPGYRLLSEFFAFPAKFLFFEVAGLGPENLARIGNSLELRLYLARSQPELEQNISADTFRLGCTPIVNLFEKKAEPIQLSHTESEYRIVPDSRRPMAFEVYSVEAVTATNPNGQEQAFEPFYSIRHEEKGAEARAFWHASRRAALRHDDQVDNGTEVFLSLVDLSHSPVAASGEASLDVQTLCLSRDLPGGPPFIGGRPGFALVDGGPVVLQCLTQPTPTRRVPLREGALWRLISHLSLNHLSLNSAEALQEVLRLYDFTESHESRAKIGGIVSVRHQRVTGRAGGATAGGFCRGVEVAIEFDEERFPDNSVFLFSTVLERFLSLYCSINSFTRLVALGKQRNGEMRQWSPRVAQRVTL
jgi:type VI secretion system protein ImpG